MNINLAGPKILDRTLHTQELNAPWPEHEHIFYSVFGLPSAMSWTFLLYRMSDAHKACAVHKACAWLVWLIFKFDFKRANPLCSVIESCVLEIEFENESSAPHRNRIWKWYKSWIKAQIDAQRNAPLIKAHSHVYEKQETGAFESKREDRGD